MNVDLKQLEGLQAVREARLNAAWQDLAGPVAALTTINLELAEIEQEIARIETQRISWEKNWQQWLNGGNILYRGQAHSRQHWQLAILEDDFAAQREDIEERRYQMEQQVKAARMIVLKCRQRVDQLAGAIAAAKREKRADGNGREARAMDELALARFSAHNGSMVRSEISL